MSFWSRLFGTPESCLGSHELVQVRLSKTLSGARYWRRHGYYFADECVHCLARFNSSEVVWGAWQEDIPYCGY